MSHVQPSAPSTDVTKFISTEQLQQSNLYCLSMLVRHLQTLISVLYPLSVVSSFLSNTIKIIIILLSLLLDTFHFTYTPGNHLTIYLHPINLILHIQHKRDCGYKLRYLSYPPSPSSINLHFVDFHIFHPIQPLQHFANLQIDPINLLHITHQCPAYQSSLNE